jgi:hypothetical protein
MLEREVSEQEVRRVLAGAQTCQCQENGRWRVADSWLVVVVAIKAGAVVVTLFRGDADEDV